MENLWEKLNKLIIFFLIYSVVFITFFSTLSYTLPFTLAVIFALILKSPTRYLIGKFKIHSTLATLLTTIVFFTIIILVLLLSVTSVTSELIQLTKNISTYLIDNRQFIYDFFDRMNKYFNSLDPSIINSIKDSLSSSISSIGKSTANIGLSAVTFILNFAASIPYIIMVVVFTLIATYFFTKDFSQQRNKLVETFFTKDSKKIVYVYSETKRMLLNYLKSYTIVLFITFAVTLIGFLIFRVKYALVLSVLCAIFDILPILGIAGIYLPLAVFYLLGGKVFIGIALIVLYGIVAIIRQIAEPRIVSSSLGLHPVAVLAAIFVGLQANGLAGMFFCIFLVVFYNILKKVNVI